MLKEYGVKDFMKKSMSLIALILFFSASIFTGCSSAQSSQYDDLKKEVHATLQGLLDKGGTSVSYAVMQDGRLVMADAVGYLDGTKKTPATTETLYNIGSISKVYCAAAVMKLVDEGKVELDTPVAAYLPEFKMQDERYQDITVRMLLDHSSGIPGTAYSLVGSYSGYDTDIYKKAYETFAISSLKADPGKFSVYCNDGFMLAEMLVSQVSGKPYSEFVHENILAPVHADSSGFANRSFSQGSFAVEGTLPHEFLSTMGPGGMSTNITDVCKFGQIFLNDGKPILSQNSIDEMDLSQGKTFISGDNYSTQYGLGWDSVGNVFGSYDFGENVLAKSGGSTQFTSQLYVIPQYDMVCAISASLDFSGDAPSVLADIAADILQVQGKDVSKQEPSAAAAAHQSLPADFISDYEGIYGAYNGILRVTANDDDTIYTELYNGTAYTTLDAKLYYDGAAFVNENGAKVYSFEEADGKEYLMAINEKSDIQYAMGQKLEALPERSAAWESRLGKLYLCNYVPADIASLLPGIKLYQDNSLPGVLFSGLADSLSPMGIQSDNATKMILEIPGNFGRNLYTLRTKQVNGEEWLYTESYDLRPADSLPVLDAASLSVNANGDNLLFKIPDQSFTFTIPEGGRVIAYDANGLNVYDSISNGAASFDKLPEEGYIRFAGKSGSEFTIAFK